MPYAKRHTTPTTAAETEGTLVVGYWVATRQANNGVVVRLCEKHMAVVNALDSQEEARVKAEEAARAAQPAQQFQDALVGINQRKEQLVANLPKPVTNPLTVPPEQPFVLGPGPLHNGNTPTSAPPLPVPFNPAQPYINTTSEPVVVQVPQPVAEPIKNPGLPQAPIQGAALIDAPCLFCKVMVKTGEVHNCPQAAGTSGLNPIG